jgi:hypothetical protein
MANVKTQSSGIITYDYDNNINIRKARWLEILRATETNPTLKDLADQMYIIYEMSQEKQKVEERDYIGG